MATTITAGNATDGLKITPDNTGILELKTGTGAGTTALTLNASQNATVAGTLQVAGISTNMYPIVSGTAITLTNQTSVEFTSIPSWAKRITVMFSAMSTNGTSVALVQTGSGSFTTSGYASSVVGGANGNVVTGTTSTSGFPILGQAFSAANAYNGVVQLLNINGNTWVAFGGASISGSGSGYTVTGNIALGGTLDRVRLFIDGTQQFDAGSVNIMWE